MDEKEFHQNRRIFDIRHRVDLIGGQVVVDREVDGMNVTALFIGDKSDTVEQQVQKAVEALKSHVSTEVDARKQEFDELMERRRQREKEKSEARDEQNREVE